ncbi:MAG: GNAT family N-acetyltransferase [Chitinophagaceae bacterium]
MDIRLLDKEELPQIYPLVQLLNPTITKEQFLLYLEEMVGQGYLCVAAFEGKTIIAISGLWMQTRFYAGKFIEPDNVVVAPAYRNKQIGQKLMQWIIAFGKANGCVASELNCYVSNSRGQKFWIDQGYSILGFHFQQKFLQP